MITTFYPPYHFGGDGVFVYRLSHALAERGHDVEVIHSGDAFNVLSPRSPAPGFAEHPGVIRHRLESSLPIADVVGLQQLGRPLAHRRRLRSLLADGRHDVIHFHNVSLVGGPQVLEFGNALKLYTMHEHWLVCPMHVLWRMGREPCERRTCVRCQLHGRRPPQAWRYTGLRDRAAKAVDMFLAPSQFTLAKHRELGFHAPVTHLPHFIETPPSADEGAPAPHPRPYFLFVGRLERLKGAHALVEAFRRFRGADLLLAGDGAERAELEGLASDLPHVHLLGSRPPDELLAYYRHALATVVPSLCFETFGLTAAESCAVGTPVIVHDRGSLSELAATGAGVAYQTEAGLIEHLERLSADGAYRAQLAARARAAYEQHWTRDQHLDRYEALIEELSAGRTKPAARGYA